MTKLLLCVSILTLAAIACIAPAAIVNTPAAKMRLSAPVTGTPETDKQMTVSGNLNLRSCAGETCPIITTLSDGDVVTFTATPPVTLFVYAWHEVTVDVNIGGTIVNLTGWVNTRYLYAP